MERNLENLIDRLLGDLLDTLARYQDKNGLTWEQVRDELNKLHYTDLAEYWENYNLDGEE